MEPMLSNWCVSFSSLNQSVIFCTGNGAVAAGSLEQQESAAQHLTHEATF